jgi:hypothetical protein
MSNRDVIRVVKNALNAIDRRDYETYRIRSINDQYNVFGDRYTTYENNFVSKFSEEYRDAERLAGINRKELHRQLQITKRYVFSDYNDPKVEAGYFRLSNDYGDNRDGVLEFDTIPDFFIHKNEHDRLPENQKLIIEFKTERNVPENRFMWDFFKLNVYLEKLNFQTACFVAINNSQDRMKQFLTKYLNNYYLSNHTDRLYILIKETYESSPIDFSVKAFIAEQFNSQQ